MRIIDTHLHLIYPGRFSYPWLADYPTINRAWHEEDYFNLARALGIQGALHMEVDVAERDILPETEFVLGAHPQILGAIASCRPENKGFDAFLDRVTTLGEVKGLRRILHQSPNELSQSELFAANIRKLAARDLSFDLCVRADQLPVGMALIDKAPEVQFVLDHCGVPDIVGDDFQAWRGAITEIARRPNLAAKLSGIVAYAGADWTLADLKPYAEHVIAVFGWDRVVWGSDFPVCTLFADLKRWVEATHALLAGASEDEKARLLHRNAERIYKLENRSI
ncbi:amidohydrolase family protein [Pelagibacterium limicola]|uniref:amidohydrolase family protein n=1 Tax=Pelagibacterium limicola TaxID=2791022 RepID=UPI0018AF9830|nr:amidohydrolase [Pelagibacterium limicola]